MTTLSTEANAVAGTIRRSITVYANETSVSKAQAELTAKKLDDPQTRTTLGFGPTDLSGTYFVPSDYSITSISASGVAIITS